MYSSTHSLFPFWVLLFISSTCVTCLANTAFRPKTLFLIVKKDPTTLQYITEVHQRTPLVPLKLAVHLGGESLWVDCERGYESSTYKPARCKSRQCNLARSIDCGDCLADNTTRIGCNNNACFNLVANPAAGTIYDGGEIADDVLSIKSVNGSFPGPVATIPRFIFSCSPSFLTESLGKDVKGMISFGQKSPVSFATQLASAFRFSRKFGICLSSSTDEKGIIFIGDSPYLLRMGFDASRDLIYTPIITHPNSIHEFGYPNSTYFNRSSSEYFLQVSSININGKIVPVNKTLLVLDGNGEGGTKISTADPYTVLESSIFEAVTKAFINEMPKDVKTVTSVPPFGTCFNSTYIGMSRLGFNAPEIKVVLHKPNVYWTITGANSLVRVNEEVICLAFVRPRQDRGQAIVIGGFQMQDNLVEFDLPRGRIGFSNSLFFHQTMCANHDFAWD